MPVRVLVQVWRGNTWIDLFGAPSWFLDELRFRLAIPLGEGPAKPGCRLGSVFWHEGQPWGSLVHGSRVPAGLLPHLEVLARNRDVPCDVRDARVRPSDEVPWWGLGGVPWRPYQDEVQRSVLREGAGVIDAPPRSGKTLMALRAVDTLALPTLWVAPSLPIVRQTFEAIEAKYGPGWVSRLDGETQGAARDREAPIVVATAASAVRQSDEWLRTRQVLVIDEFHHSAAETYHQIHQRTEHIFYRLFWTGTHFRTGDDRLAMDALASNVLRKITIDELVDHGYLAQPEVTFVRSGVTADLPSGMPWQEAYAQGVVDAEERNARVAQLATWLADAGIPTIVLTRHRSHADALGDRIPGARVVKGGETALTGRAVRDFGKGVFDVLVGTTVIGEGVDLPRAAALVYASGGSAGVLQAQSYFRPLTRANGKTRGMIFDFDDTHQDILVRHSDRRLLAAKEMFGDARVWAAPVVRRRF